MANDPTLEDHKVKKEFSKWFIKRSRTLDGDDEGEKIYFGSTKSCRNCSRWDPKESIPCGIASAACVNSMQRPLHLSFQEAEARAATPQPSGGLSLL